MYVVDSLRRERPRWPLCLLCSSRPRLSSSPAARASTCTTSDGPPLPRLHRRHRRDQHRSLPPARRRRRPGAGGQADPRPVHNRDAPAAADARRTPRRGPPREARLACSSATPAARPSRRRSGWPATPPARPNVVVFHGSFHGRTIGAASMTTSGTKFRAGFSPIMGGVAVAPFPTAYRYGWDEQTATDFALRELDYLLATVTAPAETAAFVVEPVLGEGGYVPANTGVHGGPARARRSPRHPARHRRGPDRRGDAPAASGDTTTSACSPTSWSPPRACQRVPALRHRRLRAS